MENTAKEIVHKQNRSKRLKNKHTRRRIWDI